MAMMTMMMMMMMMMTPPKRLVQELSPPCSHGGWGSSQAAMQNPSEDNRNYENDDDYDRHHHHGSQGHRHSGTVFTSSVTKKKKVSVSESSLLVVPQSLKSTRTFTMVNPAIWLSQESSKVQRHKVYVTSAAIKLIDRTDISRWQNLEKKTENCCRTSAVPWITSIWKLHVQMLEPLQSAKL